MLEGYLKYSSIFLLLFMSCFRETPVTVYADFEVEVVDNDYSVPVTVRVTNKSAGADLYAWSFEGGEPAVSNKSNPGEIIYNRAGKYLLRLEAWNTTERKVKELTLSLDSVIHAGFTCRVKINNFSPAAFYFINNSYGGNSYYWTFSGGEPAFSEGRIPPEVVFTGPGKYPVSLQVSNDRETIEVTDTIFVLPALSVDFDWQPGPDDADMEAPVLIKAAARCTSALSYRWKVPGGTIENDTLPETFIRIDTPGTYSIELVADNLKDSGRVCREIKVLENTNLYTIRDLKFGITTALNIVGAFYSSASRNVLKAEELTSGNPEIDFIFWGLPEFEQCSFISPDSAAFKALPDIAEARHTRIINCAGFITDAFFEGLENDAGLCRIEMTENSGQLQTAYFTDEHIPHYVLFETEDHRKGVIKIKEFVKAGKASYILVDIKVQKENRQL